MSTRTATTSKLTAVVLEVQDVEGARAFYDAAFGLGPELGLRTLPEDGAPTSGFRGYTLSLVVPGPGSVDALMAAAVDAGAEAVKPATKSMWGYGGALCAPDGALWTIATSAKKDPGPVTGRIDQFVVLLAASDLGASRRFYVEQGLTIDKSFPRTYAQFATGGGPVALALYTRKGLAKNAGVDPEGSGAHRMAITGDGDAFTDPDGFVWEATAA